MEEDKCFLPFRNTTLIKYQYDRLSKIFTNVYISSKTNKFNFECSLILEKNNIYSPMIALQNILNQFDKVFIISVDTPNISENTIKKIILNSKIYDLTIAKTKDGKTHNLTGIFSAKLNKQIDDMIKNDTHKVGYLIKKVNSNIVDNLNNNEFINLNTKEDYQNILKEKYD